MPESRLNPIAILRLAALAFLPLLAGLEIGGTPSEPAHHVQAKAALVAERTRCERAITPCTDETLVVADGSIK